MKEVLLSIFDGLSVIEIIGNVFFIIYGTTLLFVLIILPILSFFYDVYKSLPNPWCRIIRNVLIIFVVIVSCYLLFYLPYSRAIASPDEETRIASESSDTNSSDGTIHGGGSWTFPAPENSDGYIGNASTKKFHVPSCSYLPDSSNRTYFDTRDEALGAGYSPCGHCHP